MFKYNYYKRQFRVLILALSIGVSSSFLCTNTVLAEDAFGDNIHNKNANNLVQNQYKDLSNGEVLAYSNTTCVNPSQEEIEQILEEVAIEKGIPPIILKSIASIESDFSQF